MGESFTKTGQHGVVGPQRLDQPAGVRQVADRENVSNVFVAGEHFLEGAQVAERLGLPAVV